MAAVVMTKQMLQADDKLHQMGLHQPGPPAPVHEYAAVRLLCCSLKTGVRKRPVV
jgi:hypothetical protein